MPRGNSNTPILHPSGQSLSLPHEVSGFTLSFTQCSVVSQRPVAAGGQAGAPNVANEVMGQVPV